jgi:hypothetical protein
LTIDEVIRRVRIDGDGGEAFVVRRDIVDGRAAREVQQTLRFARESGVWTIVEIRR